MELFLTFSQNCNGQRIQVVIYANIRYLFHGLVLLGVNGSLAVLYPRVYSTPEASPFHII